LITNFNKKYFVLSLVKPAGKKEMLSYLRSFTLETEKHVYFELEGNNLKKPLVF